MLSRMATLLIRNIDDSVRDGLRVLAQRHGRSVEAEVREILAREAKTDQRINWESVATVDSGRTGHVTRDLVNSTYDDQAL
jgi:plasmid stability protein